MGICYGWQRFGFWLARNAVTKFVEEFRLEFPEGKIKALVNIPALPDFTIFLVRVPLRQKAKMEAFLFDFQQVHLCSAGLDDPERLMMKLPDAMNRTSKLVH